MTRAGRLGPDALRNFYAGRDVLVMSAIPTRDFLEPWGLVANEAMHQRLPVIATTPSAPPPAGSCATSATASSSPPGTPPRSPARCAACATTRRCAQRLGAAAARDAAAYTFAAWAAGVSAALVSVGAGQEGDR